MLAWERNLLNTPNNTLLFAPTWNVSACRCGFSSIPVVIHTVEYRWRTTFWISDDESSASVPKRRRVASVSEVLTNVALFDLNAALIGNRVLTFSSITSGVFPTKQKLFRNKCPTRTQNLCTIVTPWLWETLCKSRRSLGFSGVR